MDYWKEKCKIKNLQFPRFIGGPLDGVTDSPFRKVVRDFSKDELLYTEMRHVASICNSKDQRAVKFESFERPLNFQFAANKIDGIEKACEKVLQKGVDCVDLNIGCPARHIVTSGSGSALMSDIPRLKRILNLFRKKLKDIPFTVKMRAGFKEINAIEIAKLVQDCGVDAIAIHPRLQSQKFSGIPDYSLVAQIKKSIHLPLLFSGGICSFNDAKKVYEKTGIDGFLIGRGMWAKPWKLRQLREKSLGKEYSVDKNIILQCALTHLDNLVDFYGKNGLYCFRKHLSFYVKGIPFSSTLKEMIFKTTSVDKIKECLAEFLGSVGV